MSEDVGYKQVLTRKDLFGIAVGMIIGAGVMTLTGIGIYLLSDRYLFCAVFRGSQYFKLQYRPF
jgi:hypothetical protein